MPARGPRGRDNDGKDGHCEDDNVKRDTVPKLRSRPCNQHSRVDEGYRLLNRRGDRNLSGLFGTKLEPRSFKTLVPLASPRR